MEVPRARAGGSVGDVLGRYRRRTSEIDDAITAAYVHGVSTRKMGEVTKALMGERVGRSTVSRVTKSLEERVEALRNERIEGEVPYLYSTRPFSTPAGPGAWKTSPRWSRTAWARTAIASCSASPSAPRSPRR